MIALGAVAISEAATMGTHWAWRLVACAAIGLCATCIARGAVLAPVEQRLRRQRRVQEQLVAQVDQAALRAGISATFDDMLSVAATEGEILSAASAAFRVAMSDHTTDLLICSAPTGLVGWVASITVDGIEAPRPFTGDGRCVSVETATTAVAPDSTQLGASPHLAGLDPCSSVCVPIMVGGNPVAVLRATGPVGDLPDPEDVALAEAVVARTRRALRALRPSADAAPTDIIDPLTSLPNHLTAKRAMAELIGGFVPFAIAVCDIDGLERINHEQGAEHGDRSIRLFANALKGTLRPTDVVVRWGGDEFLVVFPRCSAINAQAAMERVRERQVLELAVNGSVPFTASVGVADSNQGDDMDQLIETADIALSVAKAEGGGRVRTAVFD